MRIFIDAGHNHSGFNTGAVGNGMREQDITFEVSYKLGEILKKAGLDVRLSRPVLETNLGTDNASAINARWQLANFWGAELFISVHVNAGGGTGVETLYGKDDSHKLAQTLQDVYAAALELRSRRVWRREDLAVVKHTNAPAVLVELGFIDAPSGSLDVDILKNRRQDMAQALADGIFAYLGINANVQADEAKEGAPETTQVIERFNSIAQMPDWAGPTIEKLVKKGYLVGDGTGLDLSRDMIRMFVIFDRAGLF